MNQPITIESSKSKLTLILIASLAFSGLGIFALIFGVIEEDIPIIICAVIILAFFGFATNFMIKKLKDKTPGIIIDQKGVHDNTSGVSVGLISWNDIENIRIENVLSSKFIVIDVKNPDDYLEKIKSPLMKRAAKTNVNLVRSPLTISANSLEIGLDELFKLITDQALAQGISINEVY